MSFSSNFKDISGKIYYITTPIYYLNDKPHIGHFYTSLLSDSLIRYLEFKSLKTIQLTGTDEHGQKVQKSAQIKDKKEQEYCDEMSFYFKSMLRDFNLKFSENNFENDTNFIRTTDIRHKNFVRKVWQRMIENEWIYLSKYSGYYSQRDEAFYDEKELIDGKAPSGSDVEFKEEECYFFRLSYFKEIFLKASEKKTNKLNFITKNRINEITSFVSKDLQDIPVSRIIRKKENNEVIFNWGIDIPQDKKHVMYVWLDF
jgi:methionyl-tRNA synthetase